LENNDDQIVWDEKRIDAIKRELKSLTHQRIVMSVSTRPLIGRGTKKKISDASHDKNDSSGSNRDQVPGIKKDVSAANAAPWAATPVPIPRKRSQNVQKETSRLNLLYEDPITLPTYAPPGTAPPADDPQPPKALATGKAHGSADSSHIPRYAKSTRGSVVAPSVTTSSAKPQDVFMESLSRPFRGDDDELPRRR